MRPDFYSKAIWLLKCFKIYLLPPKYRVGMIISLDGHYAKIVSLKKSYKKYPCVYYYLEDIDNIAYSESLITYYINKRFEG